MPEIIIFGDINISPLYISVDGSKEMMVLGKKPRCFDIRAGAHEIFATTETKLQRACSPPRRGFLDSLNSDAGFIGWLNNVMTDETTSSVSGTVCLDSDEVLLIQVKQENVFRMQINSEVIKASEVGKYVDMDTVVAYGEKPSGGKTALRYLSVGSCWCDHEHLWAARPSCICWTLSYAPSLRERISRGIIPAGSRPSSEDIIPPACLRLMIRWTSTA